MKRPGQAICATSRTITPEHRMSPKVYQRLTRHPADRSKEIPKQYVLLWVLSQIFARQWSGV